MKTISLIAFLLYSFSSLFGQQTVGLFQNDDSAMDGYTLFGNNQITYLIDECGNVVKIWKSDHDPGLSSYLLKNGNLLRTGRIDGFFNGAGIGGQFELFNWEGDLIWNFEYLEDDIQAHHDIEPLPNGNFLFIAWERISEEEAQSYGRKYEGEVWSEKIIEMEIVGTEQANIVWEWRLWDHLIQDYDSTKNNFGVVSEHPELVDLNYIGAGERTNGDWAHLNGISYNEDLDQIALSARHFSEIWIIDHSTSTEEAQTSSGGNANRGGDLLYRYGNPNTYQRGTDEDQVFFKQHDVRWVPKGYPQEGNLMVYNNIKSALMSSVEVWNPPLNSDGTYTLNNNEAFGPTAPNLTYTTPSFFSRILSGAHFLPNGNLFVTEGITGRFLEISPEEEKVWEYINPAGRDGSIIVQGEPLFRNDVFRATKYPVDYEAFEGKILEPGIPIEQNPIDIGCVASTPPPIPPVSDELEIKILGNPILDVLKFETNFSDPEIKIALTDVLGKTIIEQPLDIRENKLEVSNLAAGVYLLYFINDKKIYEVFKICKL